MTRNPNPLDVALDLTAEVERLRAERDYCQRYYHNVVVEAKRLKAERDEARAQAAAHKKLADIAIEALRPLEESEHKFAALYQESRAQAARLAEALRGVLKWIPHYTSDAGHIEKQEDCPGCRIEQSIRDIHNSRAWLREQIAAELESWRAARAIKPECVVEVDERIAELRRKEPCCGCLSAQAPDKDRHCPCNCHAELRRKEEA